MSRLFVLSLLLFTAAACQSKEVPKSERPDALPEEVDGPCGKNTAMCSEACVNLRTDPKHCGRCDRVCDPSVPCVNGGCAPVCGGKPLFSTSKTLPVESANSIVLADFNNDQIDDLGFATTNPGRVVIAFGLGDGDFRLPREFTSAPDARSIATVDFNADGFLDVVTSELQLESRSSEKNRLTVFLSEPGIEPGTRAFTQPRTTEVPGRAYFLATGKLGADPYADVIALHPEKHTATHFSWSNDSNSLVAGAHFSSGGNSATRPTNPSYAQLADINGNGYDDLLVAHANDRLPAIAVFSMSEKADFQYPQLINVQKAPDGFTLIDVNNDSVRDLVVMHRRHKGISFLLGTKTGNFEFSRFVEVGSSPFAASVADVNHDEVNDILVLDQGEGTTPGAVYVLHGKGDGTFLGPIATEVGVRPTGMVLGDFNHDQKVDVAVSNEGSDSVSLLLNVCE